MENNNNITDALGNQILIGRSYGYSYTANGHLHSVIGRAKKFTGDKRCTLEDVYEKSGIYGEFTTEFTKGKGRSCYGALLFPIGYPLIS